MPKQSHAKELIKELILKMQKNKNFHQQGTKGSTKPMINKF